MRKKATKRNALKYTITGGGLKSKSTLSKVMAKRSLNARIKKVLDKPGKKKISVRVAKVV